MILLTQAHLLLLGGCSGLPAAYYKIVTLLNFFVFLAFALVDELLHYLEAESLRVHGLLGIIKAACVVRWA